MDLEEQKKNLKELEILAVRFIGLPDMLSSPQRSSRVYANRVLNEILLKQYNELTYELEETDLETEYFLSDYTSALGAGDYSKARRVARRLLSSIRSEYSVLCRSEEFFRNHNP